MTEVQANEDLCEELDRLMASTHSDEILVVTCRTLRTALGRFLAREVAGSDLVVWASLIEAHDRVTYESGFEALIADIIFCIASPEINGFLSDESCRRLLSQLGAP
jgi:hypothetical protein